MEKKSRTAAFVKAKDFFRKVKESLSCDVPFLSPVPAFAGVPGFVPPDASNLSKPFMEFHTGEVPFRGSSSRKIMEWESIDILEPGERLRKNTITYDEAQQEVSKIRKTRHSSHQDITYEAAKLCAAYPEATKYTLHLMAGAAAEDYFFRPKESLDDLYATPPEKRFRNKREFSRLAGGDVPSFFSGLFRTISRLWKKIKGSPDDDSINRPYFAHFYDPRRDEGDRGLNVLNGDLKFQSALERMKIYWRVASDRYVKGDKPRAFCALGHLIHLVQDLHVPAHTHNDIHGPTVFLGKLDSFESWCARADYPHITRPEDNENIRIWDSGALAPPLPDRSWNPTNIKEELTDFTNSFVTKTQRFRSVDAEGTDRNQRKKGKLNGGECFYQGSFLIPQAINNSAQLIVNFLDYHGRLSR